RPALSPAVVRLRGAAAAATGLRLHALLGAVRADAGEGPPALAADGPGRAAAAVLHVQDPRPRGAAIPRDGSGPAAEPAHRPERQAVALFPPEGRGIGGEGGSSGAPAKSQAMALGRLRFSVNPSPPTPPLGGERRALLAGLAAIGGLRLECPHRRAP